ncbi:hypothetical protein GCM10022249_20630 [Enteractinococcus coprophilus]
MRDPAEQQGTGVFHQAALIVHEIAVGVKPGWEWVRDIHAGQVQSVALRAKD